MLPFMSKRPAQLDPLQNILDHLRSFAKDEYKYADKQVLAGNMGNPFGIIEMQRLKEQVQRSPTVRMLVAEVNHMDALRTGKLNGLVGALPQRLYNQMRHDSPPSSVESDMSSNNIDTSSLAAQKGLVLDPPVSTHHYARFTYLLDRTFTDESPPTSAIVEGFYQAALAAEDQRKGQILLNIELHVYAMLHQVAILREQTQLRVQGTSSFDMAALKGATNALVKGISQVSLPPSSGIPVSHSTSTSLALITLLNRQRADTT